VVTGRDAGHARPDLASAECGRCIAERFVERYAEVGERVLWEGEAAPRAPFSFLEALTLGGRLEPTFVPVAEVTADPLAR